MNKIRSINSRRALLAIGALFLLVALSVTACGGAAKPAATAASAGAALITPASAVKSAPGATPAPQANKQNSNVDCAAIFKANTDFGPALAQMVNFTAQTDYPGFTDTGSPVYLDFPKLRADLNTLATLPDPTDQVDLAFGKPSDSITYFRQLVDVAESDVKSKGNPFKDTGADGQKIFGIDSPWFQKFNPFSLAIDKACHGFTVPTDAPPSALTSNHIGENATLGDMHITLDKVATVAGDVGNLPDAGNRFVVVSATLENSGKTPLTTLSFSTSTLKDAAGNVYGFDQHVIAISAAKSGLIDGEIPAGEKRSGSVGYQLPIDAGDLTWTLVDFAQHQVVFAIKAGDIVTVGTPINAATEAVMQDSFNATETLIFQLGQSADETEAATTVMPEVTDVPEATDVPEVTDDPQPTDAPESSDAPQPTDAPDATETPGS